MLVVVVLALIIIVTGIAILLFMPSQTYIYDFEPQEVAVSRNLPFTIDEEDGESDTELTLYKHKVEDC